MLKLIKGYKNTFDATLWLLEIFNDFYFIANTYHSSLASKDLNFLKLTLPNVIAKVRITLKSSFKPL